MPRDNFMAITADDWERIFGKKKYILFPVNGYRGEYIKKILDDVMQDKEFVKRLESADKNAGY
jgi:hypothetical protein